MDFKLLWAPFEQLLNSPSCFLIIVPISILAGVWEMMQSTPSKYIPIVCLVAGTGLYPALTSVSTVPPGFPNPSFVLFLNGFILGFVAYLLHKFLIKKLIEKFQPDQVQTKALTQAIKDAPVVAPPPVVIVTPPPTNPPTAPKP
jgi:hypothetical protein